MISFKSILPMMILIILSFLTPTSPMHGASSSNPSGRGNDLKTCFHSLVNKCGSPDRYPAVEHCVSAAFMFWDEETFSNVRRTEVRKVLKNYYESFADNIHPSVSGLPYSGQFPRPLWGPSEFCNNVSHVLSIDYLRCQNELQQFKSYQYPPNSRLGGLGQGECAAIVRRSFSAVIYYEDEAPRAIRYGLYNTKLSDYVNLENVNEHNIVELLRTNSVIPSPSAPNYYAVNYMAYISNACKVDKLVLKNPKEYCIEKLYPEMSSFLSDSNNSEGFFFS